MRRWTGLRPSRTSGRARPMMTDMEESGDVGRISSSMLTGSMKAAPRPWTFEPAGGPSGGDPAGGGLLELASCGEGFFGSSGNSSSAMIYSSIIGYFQGLWAVEKASETPELRAAFGVSDKRRICQLEAAD